MYELRQVEKRFPGVHALKAINFKIGDGEIVGLVGENGAGKSTLMKVIYGAVRPDSGDILIDGKSVKFQNPRQAMQMGIGMVFQEQSLILNLSVMENLFLGYEHEFARMGVVNWRAMAEAAKVQLNKVKLNIDPTMSTARLSFAQRQLVELAKVLTLETRVDGKLIILLDEPTSVLSKDEVGLLFRLVRELRSRASFIFVSHRLDEVMEISDRIYVFKDGAVVDEFACSEASVETIQHKMVGRNVDKEYYREQKQKPFNANAVLLDLTDVTVANKCRGISFRLHAGEVLCLVGIEGSGREAVLRTIFGMLTPSKGSVTIKGNRVARFRTRSAVAQGVGYVPRERKVEGIVNGMSIYENVTLAHMHRHSSYGVLKLGEEKSLARDWIKRLSIKAPSEMANCGNLSGGNQQKVVLSKWRSGGADIMLLDHPTRGLDIGAKEDVYDLIREMSDSGVGIILVADTLEEAIGLSHNILVFKDGVIEKSYEAAVGSKPSPYDLIQYMI